MAKDSKAAKAGADAKTKTETKVETKAETKTESKPETKAAAKNDGAAKAESPGTEDKSKFAGTETATAGSETSGAAPANYSRGEGQKPVTAAYRENWNAIFAKKKASKKRR